MAGRTVQAVGRWLFDCYALFDEERQALGRVALATASRYGAIFVPMTECLFGTSEVTMINAVGIGSGLPVPQRLR